MRNDTRISLREITAETVHKIMDLEVLPDQRPYVATNAASLAEASFAEEAWHRAIYLGDEPVGFVMLYDESLRVEPPPRPRIVLWRFMVDARYQRRGVGTTALQQVVEHVRRNATCDTFLVSYVPGPGCPERFYLRAGFRHTGQVDDGEVVLKLDMFGG